MLLLDLVFAQNGPRLAIAQLATSAHGLPATRPRTVFGTRPGKIKVRPMPPRRAKAKARAKARKARKARKAKDELHLHLKNEDDLEKRKFAEVDRLLLRKTGLPLLHPRSVARPRLVPRISLSASDGLKALALTRIVGIGIPRLVVTSKQETA